MKQPQRENGGLAAGRTPPTPADDTFGRLGHLGTGMRRKRIDKKRSFILTGQDANLSIRHEPKERKKDESEKCFK